MARQSHGYGLNEPRMKHGMNTDFTNNCQNPCFIPIVAETTVRMTE